MSHDSFPYEAFKEFLAANDEYTKTFKYSGLTGTAEKGLAIVTCMDSRINPLSVMGMKSGDAKILRNAGARVTEDVLRTLVLATYLLVLTRFWLCHTQIVEWLMLMKQRSTKRSTQNTVSTHRH
jgi:carbonic anhydrase